MSIQLVLNYVRDAVLAYQRCTAALGLPASPLNLSDLLRAARTDRVRRQGELVTQGGIGFRYHVHGTGYSFTELGNGRQTNFDVCIVGGEQCLRFTVWHLLQYASSVGQDLTRDAVLDALQEPDATQSQLVRVTEDGFDFYCYPVAATKN
jgi:hypothetical protein